MNYELASTEPRTHLDIHLGFLVHVRENHTFAGLSRNEQVWVQGRTVLLSNRAKVQKCNGTEYIGV